ncbi:MAG: YdbH domain-containing protein [Pseudohongiellaceae bacterium]|nr:YdbH domain-containing protein [Pseudohongiellaceae bacterium]
MRLIKRFTKLLVLLLGFSAILLAICWVLLRPLTQVVSNHLLAPLGLSVSTIDSFQLGLSQLRIKSIVIVNQNNQSSARIDQLSLSYSLSSLIDGTLGQLIIGELSTEPSFWQLSKAQTSTVQSDQFALPSPSSLITPPLSLINIQHLTISPWIDSAAMALELTPRSASLSLSHFDTKASADINWHNENYTSSFFVDNGLLEAENFNSGSYTASLAMSQDDIAVITAEVTLHEHLEVLEAQANLDLEQISLLLTALDLFPSESINLGGAMDLELAVGGFNTSPNIQASAQLRNDASAQWQYESHYGNVYFSGAQQPSPVQFTFDSDSGLALNWSSGNIATDYSSELGTINANILLQQLHTRCTLNWQCDASGQLVVESERIELQETLIEDSRLLSEFELAGNDESLTLNIAHAELRSESIHSAAAHISAFTAQLTETLTLTIEALTKTKIEQAGIDLNFTQASVDDTVFSGNLSLSNIQGELQLELPKQSLVQAQALLHELQISGLDFSLPDIDSQVAYGSGQLTGTGHALFGDEVFADFTIQHDLDTTRGEARITQTPLDLSLPSLRREWLEQLSNTQSHFIAGNIDSAFTLAWHQEDSQWQYNGDGTVSIKRLSGFIAETGFVDLSTSTHLRIMNGPSLSMPDSAELTLARLDPGIPIENIAAEYRIDQGQTTITLSDIRGSIFGGQIKSQDFEYNWTQPDSAFTLDVERIDLAKIMELSAYEAVKATGTVSGAIPLTLRNNTIQVANGQLSALQPGGSIKYTASGSPSNNASLDFVNEALSNYQYDFLQAGLSYRDDGELVLGVTLQGKNPDMNNGQRINLNLNITDNVPALLRSLQAGRNINEAVEKQLRNSQ